MTTDTYAAPSAELSNASEGDYSVIMAPLLSTRPWVRFLSIMGFIFTGFICLGALGVLAAGGIYTPMGAGFSAGIAIAYLVFAMFMLVPSLLLFKYASAITSADLNRDDQAVAKALGYQKSLWKFMGVLTLIYLVVALIGIAAAIIVPILAG